MEDSRAHAGYFDPGRGAWVLSRYAEVVAALRDPRLAIPGAEVGSCGDQGTSREAGPNDLFRTQPAAWRSVLGPTAHELLRTLPEGQPVDLVRAFAEPWSQSLALQITGAAPTAAAELIRLAREVFLAAAVATRPDVSPAAQAATAELARGLNGAAGPLGVQAFVALSQTLPCLLSAAWRELFRHPEQARRLRAEPRRMPAAVEELLRVASPARAVFRRARREARIGAAVVGAGDLVILMLAAANHDPTRFPDPERLDFDRRASAHLAFGTGPHACAGSRLVRLAVGVATEALLGTTDVVDEVDSSGQIGGFAIRAPATLRVVLHRRSDAWPSPICAVDSAPRRRSHDPAPRPVRDVIVEGDF